MSAATIEKSRPPSPNSVDDLAADLAHERRGHGCADVLEGKAQIGEAATLVGKLDTRFTTNPDGSLRFTIDRRAPLLGGGFEATASSYIMVALHGNLIIARTFTITGDFQLKVSGTGKIILGTYGAIEERQLQPGQRSRKSI